MRPTSAAIRSPSRGFRSRLAQLAAACGAALAALGACKSRDFNATKGPADPAVSGVNQSGSAAGKPLLNWLYVNDATFRGYAATNLESQLAALLSSGKPEEAPLREMAHATIRALRRGGDKICADSAKVTVFRGHGYGLLPTTKDGKKLVLAHALTSGLGRFSGEDWEAQALKLYPTHNLDVSENFKAYAAPAPKCGNGEIEPGAVGQYDYRELAGRHTLWCPNSPFLSVSLETEVARAFNAPIIEARVCPGRALPTSLQPFGNEAEWLVFGFLLPEEIVKIHSPGTSALFRKGIKDPAAKEKAANETASVVLPSPKEPDLVKCSTNAIGLQSSPQTAKYVQDKLNGLTDMLTASLARERTGASAGLEGWKAKFGKECNCDTFVKDNAFNRDDWCM